MNFPQGTAGQAQQALPGNSMLTRILETMVDASRHHLITPDAALEDDLHLDLLARAYDLPLAVEEAFGIEVGDAEIEKWHSVADVIATVRAYAGERVSQ